MNKSIKLLEVAFTLLAIICAIPIAIVVFPTLFFFAASDSLKSKRTKNGEANNH